MMQRVIEQSFEDDLKVPRGSKFRRLADLESSLMKCDPNCKLTPEQCTMLYMSFMSYDYDKQAILQGNIIHN